MCLLAGTLPNSNALQQLIEEGDGEVVDEEVCVDDMPIQEDAGADMQQPLATAAQVCAHTSC